jgi:hypothetical protein
MYIFQDIKQHIEEKHENYQYYKDEIRNYSKRQGEGMINRIDEVLKQLNFILSQFSAGDVMELAHIYTRYHHYYHYYHHYHHHYYYYY